MPHKYRVNSHAVEGSKIVSIQPLVAQGRVLAPNAGLTLVLDDESKNKWLNEPNAPTPAVGDFLVRDDELHVAFVVPAAKFKTLFKEANSRA